MLEDDFLISPNFMWQDYMHIKNMPIPLKELAYSRIAEYRIVAEAKYSPQTKFLKNA
jgi:hypothetical protein